jgi:hypothetical protein
MNLISNCTRVPISCQLRARYQVEVCKSLVMRFCKIINLKRHLEVIFIIKAKKENAPPIREITRFEVE